MKHYRILVLAAAVLAGCSAKDRDIVTVNPSYGGKFDIVGKWISTDEALYVFQGSEGIFSFDIEPGPISFKKVTFILRNQRKLSSLSLGRSFNDWNPIYNIRSPATGAPPGMPASTAPGVSVRQDGDDFHVTFTDVGIKLLERGGRFQIIDEWRR